MDDGYKGFQGQVPWKNSSLPQACVQQAAPESLGSAVQQGHRQRSPGINISTAEIRNSAKHILNICRLCTERKDINFSEDHFHPHQAQLS